MVDTDHKNLEKEGPITLSDRVYQWALLLEKFAPRIEYIKGTNNLVADVIIRLEYTPSKYISSHFHFMKALMTKYDPNVKHHVK